MTLFQVLVMMLVMAGPKAGHDFVNDAPHDESLQYADQVADHDVNYHVENE